MELPARSPRLGSSGGADTPDRVAHVAARWLGGPMAADNTHRSEIRSVSVNCRMTVKQRDELKRLAAAAGCSMQTFMLRKMFDQADLQDLPHGARSLHYGRGRKKPTVR